MCCSGAAGSGGVRRESSRTGGGFAAEHCLHHGGQSWVWRPEWIRPEGRPTPALDKLATEGTRFTQAYAIAPVCTPTRVGLMTGQYPACHRAGLWEPIRTKFKNEGLDPAVPTVARRLRDAGYHTGLVGKWHLGMEPGLRPTDHGFDQWFSILSGAADYVTHRSTEPGDPDGPHTLYQNGKDVHAEGYLTDLFTGQAEAFLRSAKSALLPEPGVQRAALAMAAAGAIPAYPKGKDPASVRWLPGNLCRNDESAR